MLQRALLLILQSKSGSFWISAKYFVKQNRVIVVLFIVSSVVAYIQRTRRPTTRSLIPIGVPVAKILPNGKRELWVPYRGELTKVVIDQTPPEVFAAHRERFRESKGTFKDDFRAILVILIPSPKDKVVLYLILHMIFLGVRTYLSLVVAALDGRIVQNIIAARGRNFFFGLLEWQLLAVPASYTNAMIKYLEGVISLNLRTKLVRYIHDLYVGPDLEYYKLTNVDGAISYVDNFLASDVPRFCDAVAALYSDLGKPSFDIAVFALQLYRHLGGLALVGLFLNYIGSGAALKSVAPPFGHLAAAETKLEGNYRASHQQLIANSEEIAFYDGAVLEKHRLSRLFERLMDHINRALKIKAVYNVIEEYILKYTWSASGLLFASIPVLVPWMAARHSEKESDRMGDFITNRRLMVSLADAGGRIMYSIKDLAELAGYTQRLFELLSALHRVHANDYPYAGEWSLGDVRGSVRELKEGETTSVLSFCGTPVVVPGGADGSPGEPLLQALRLEISEGDHLLITGSNGSSKTSIARMCARLWPLYRGILGKPRRGKITFLTQRVYFSSGTLRDQIIYPYTFAEMLEMGHSDNDLLELLKTVHLEYLPEREGGFSSRKEWTDVFSGGEKQRMLFARILFAKPRVAVVDEGTSAVSADMEGVLYDALRKRGITVVTISHRISLLRYHNCLLTVGLGPDGSEWKFERSNTKERRMGLEKEINRIRSRLDQMPRIRQRRDEVVRMLQGKASA